MAPSEKPPPNQARRINMHEISVYDYLMANLHLSMEGTDSNPIQVQSELSDPTPLQDFDTSGQVLINAAKQSKPAHNPADIQHVLSNKPKTSASSVPKASEEIIVKTYW